MKNNILYNAFYILHFTLCILMVACTDIVEVDDLRARENPKSNGIPEIKRIVLASDTLNVIAGANFEDMVRIEGKNLGNVTSIKFNDIEVPQKDYYAVYDMIVVPVPRVLPGEVSDKLYITTLNGQLEIPFTVSIPRLKINGLYNEFANAGDTTTISGDNFDLYGITVEEAILNVGTIPVTVLSADRTSLTIQIPNGAPSNSVISLLGSQMNTPYQIPYKQPGIAKMINFDDFPGTGGFTHANQFPNLPPNFLCTGNEGTDFPKPLETGAKYIRFKGDVGAWGWMVFWFGYVTIPAEVAANPAAYDMRFEILTNAKYPLSTSARLLFGANYVWYPATDGIPLNTFGQWKTVSISADAADLFPATIDPSVNADFRLIITPETPQSFDISLCNFRFARK